MTVILDDRFKLRRGTAANLATVNEVPLEGEIVYETDQGLTGGKYKVKIGDGSTHYNDLPYVQLGGGVESIVPGRGIGVDTSDPKNPIVSSTLGSIALSGRKPTYADLPAGLGSGDAGKAYYVEADGLVYIWSGTAFPASGGGINIGATTYASVVPGTTNFATVSGTGLILASQISVVELDDGGLWDAVNKRFIIKQSGVYSIVAQFRTTASATLNPYIKVNGRYVSVSPSPPAFDHSTVASLRLAVGDAVELWFYHVESVGVVGTADTDFGQAQRFSILGPL